MSPTSFRPLRPRAVGRSAVVGDTIGGHKMYGQLLGFAGKMRVRVHNLLPTQARVLRRESEHETDRSLLDGMGIRRSEVFALLLGESTDAAPDKPAIPLREQLAIIFTGRSRLRTDGRAGADFQPRRRLRRRGGRPCCSGRDGRRRRRGRGRGCRPPNQRCSRSGRDRGCRLWSMCRGDRRDGRGRRTHSKRDRPGRGHAKRRRSARRNRTTSAVKLKCPRVLISLLANPQILLLLFKSTEGGGVKQLLLLLGAPTGFKVGLGPLEAERFFRQDDLLPSAVGEITLVLEIRCVFELPLMGLNDASREAEMFGAPRRRAVVQLLFAWKKRPYAEQRVQRTSKRRLRSIGRSRTGRRRRN